jgi:hypothetical protein
MSYKGTTFVHKESTKLKIRDSLQGNVPWNKDSRHIYIENEKHPQWKGDNASYTAIHAWVYRHFGKADKCENCTNKDHKRFEWANISGEYKRVREDWKMLCSKCHANEHKNWEKRWHV